MSLCFLDKSGEKETQSHSVLEVGVQEALDEVKWDEVAFKQRGGLYDWAKDATANADACGGGMNEDLVW
ncbi:hypothetical protein LTR78_003478 [Recurvomyces mirabilis]|uniref:Uncharacterized protein n=1 Tax=Recurvomyces mirabilis TaxID=574656 RepID=A0AAE0WRW1_9PEZI|nr:hypothetical protein LTR78_003478 [Recurvomyces mirabilis]